MYAHTIKYAVLSALREVSLVPLDIAIVIHRAGYGASIGVMECEQRKLDRERLQKKMNAEIKQKLNKHISRLKCEGLIEVHDGAVSISIKGIEQLKTISPRRAVRLDPAAYTGEPSNKFAVVSYDIPTSFNRERNAVRLALNALGFEMLHRSVWYGKNKIPEQFIRDLELLGVLKFVKIFEVTKTGTIHFRS